MEKFLEGQVKTWKCQTIVTYFLVIMVSVLIVILKNLEIKNSDSDGKRLIALSDHEFREQLLGMFVK